MAIKTCLNCEKLYTKGVSGFDIFPREDHRWCSWKCLFLWLIKHDVRHNGEPITGIIAYKPRRELSIEDCIREQERTEQYYDYLLN